MEPVGPEPYCLRYAVIQLLFTPDMAWNPVFAG